MKFIYLVKHWIPFPSSEYGGVHVVIAEHAAEVASLIKSNATEWDLADYPDHEERIMRVVEEAPRFMLMNNDEVSRIAYAFTT